MGKRELSNLSSWCLVMVERLFLTVPRGCLQFVIVVFPDHTHLLFLVSLLNLSSWCLVMVERLFLAVPRGCLRFVIVVFPDHTHLLFLMSSIRKYHKYKLQATPWYREEEPHINHGTPGRQTKQSNQLSLPHRDDCKATMDTK